MAHPQRARLNVARATDDPTPKRPKRPAGANRLLLQERRRRAWRLRVAGLNTEAIALQLAADPSINSLGEAVEGGYGAQNYYDGKPPPSYDQLRKEASADIALLNRRRDGSIDRDEGLMFEVAIERIESAIAAMWPKIGDASQLHIGRLIEAIDLEARLMGWVKSPVTVNVDASTNVAVESSQPDTTPEYMREVVAAIVEAQLEPPHVIAAIESRLPDVPVDDDVIDAPGDEVPVAPT